MPTVLQPRSLVPQTGSTGGCPLRRWDVCAPNGRTSVCRLDHGVWEVITLRAFDGGTQDRGSSDRLTIALESDSQGVRVTLVGEMDLATVPWLDRVLDELAGDEPTADSVGVSFLATAARAAGRLPVPTPRASECLA